MNADRAQFPNVVIRASAGTGKTYRLTGRYLGLAAAGEPLDTILATTFTRKAAGEILARVLVRLAEAATDPAKLARLCDDLGDSALDRARCLELLAAMIRRLHRLRVSTLDSFFIQIARSFSLELGLPPGWQIIDEIDDEKLRAEAIRGVLQDEATGDVVKLMHLLTKGEAARSVSEQIDGIVSDLYALYVEAPAAAWDSLPRHKPLDGRELRAAIEALAGAELPPDKRFAKARDDSVACCECEDWLTFLSKGFVPKILDGSEQYYKKPIPAPAIEACKTLICHARAVVLGQIANQTEATRRLLEHFDRAYQRLKFGQRAMRFEDVTRKLGEAWVAERLDDVVYRLDSHISHLLLDEFQDTAPLQWRVLRPFAGRVCDGSARRSFFCVGDVKQAIYGWRGGVAEIFDAIEEELAGLAPESLNKSWRCSAPVIETVNRVFQNLTHNSVLEKYATAARRWAARYQAHSTARCELAGYCRLVAAQRAEEGEDQGETTLRFAATQVAAMHKAAPGFTIGVLVRRNAAVARLIYELRQLGVEASEEGGNPLTDSAAVQAILSLLTLADHPGHLAARYHVAHSPLGPAVGLSRYEDDAAAWKLAYEIRCRLLDQGYGPTIYDWVRRLAPSCDRRDPSRLLQLVELAYSYEVRATMRADDFVNLVSYKRVEDPRAADVRVMTVHQSKGLEFDIVVLPELDVRLTGQPPQVVVGRPGPAKDIERVLRYVSSDLRPLLPESFGAMFEQHECRVVEESLCVLYVALTRAIHALHLIVAPSADNEGSLHSTSAGLLRAALTDGQRLEPGTVAFETGEPRWYGHIEDKARSRETPAFTPGPSPEAGEGRKALTPGQPAEVGEGREESLVVRLAKPSKRPLRGLDRCSPSELEGGSHVRLGQRLRLDAGNAFDRGSLMHAWFELIEWLDDGPPEEKLLRERALAILPGPEIEKLLSQFHKALDCPAICAALSRSTLMEPCLKGPESVIHAGPEVKQARWRVWRERPFALRDEDAILSGKIDRLVVLYDGERPIGADVLDFKTDAISTRDAAAIESRVEFYRPQLESYRRAAARLVGLDTSRILARLVFTEPGIVRIVAAASNLE